MTCSRCHRADCRVSELVHVLMTDNAPGVPMLDRVAAMLECVTRQAEALEAENKRMRGEIAVHEANTRGFLELYQKTNAEVSEMDTLRHNAHEENLRLISDCLALQDKLGPVYSLLEGNSVSERGTLTNGEGGILQARNVWTLVDLQRAEALAVGAQCKLDGDEVWIRREE